MIINFDSALCQPKKIKKNEVDLKCFDVGFIKLLWFMIQVTFKFCNANDDVDFSY